MSKYYLDTEFVTATKGVVHFFEVAILHENKITDFHFRPTLNSWEKKYIERCLNGKYGAAKVDVFSQVELLVNSKIDFEKLTSDFQQLNIEYSSQSDLAYQDIFSIFANGDFYVWDTSLDSALFKYCEHDYRIVDVQVKWKKRFNSQQVGLEHAYKLYLYNCGLKDEKGLLAGAHLACFDVGMLREIDVFIDTYSGDQLIPIPISVEQQEYKLVKLRKQLKDNMEFIARLQEVDLDSLSESDLNKHLRKLAKANHRKLNFEQKIIEIQNVKTYEKPWW